MRKVFKFGVRRVEIELGCIPACLFGMGFEHRGLVIVLGCFVISFAAWRIDL